MKNTTVIEAKKLSKDYRVKEKRSFWNDLFKPKFRIVKAVNGISFSIKEGESVAFIGPNGAGKTTTTKMLSGLMYPTSGELMVLGYTPFERNREMLRRIGLIMGNKTGLNWDLTPLQSYQLFKKIYKIDQNEYDTQMTYLTELLDVKKYLNIQVRRLSLGERMKMELIGAILHNPEVLFLDEPTLGLDLISRQRIREFLRKIQDEFDVTLLLTSHDMDDVEKVCDRVIIINEGHIIYDDTLKSLMARYTDTRHLTFVYRKKPPRDKIEKQNFGEIADEGRNSWSFSIPAKNVSDLITYQMNTFDILDVDIISPPLDEIISQIFESGEALT